LLIGGILLATITRARVMVTSKMPPIKTVITSWEEGDEGKGDVKYSHIVKIGYLPSHRG
jgi:hypothetical protein